MCVTAHDKCITYCGDNESQRGGSTSELCKLVWAIVDMRWFKECSHAFQIQRYEKKTLFILNLALFQHPQPPLEETASQTE
jgi:hypothetical protein